MSVLATLIAPAADLKILIIHSPVAEPHSLHTGDDPLVFTDVNTIQWHNPMPSRRVPMVQVCMQQSEATCQSLRIADAWHALLMIYRGRLGLDSTLAPGV